MPTSSRSATTKWSRRRRSQRSASAWPARSSCAPCGHKKGPGRVSTLSDHGGPRPASRGHLRRYSCRRRARSALAARSRPRPRAHLRSIPSERPTSAVFSYVPCALDGAGVALACSNAHDLLEIKNKYFPVPNFAGFGRPHDRFDHEIDEPVINRNLDFRLRHELNDILGAAINLGVSALPAKAPHFRDGQPPNPDVAHRPSNLVELEGFDDRGYELHPTEDPCTAPTAAWRKAPLVPGTKYRMRSAA